MATDDFKPFDISTLAQDDTTTIELRHPVTDDPIPGVTATIYGQDSEQCREATRKATAKYTEYARRHRGKLMPPEDQEKLDFDKIVACTKSINGLSLEGKPITDIAEIFNQVPAFREQIQAEIHTRENFIKTSARK